MRFEIREEAAQATSVALGYPDPTFAVWDVKLGVRAAGSPFRTVAEAEDALVASLAAAEEIPWVWRDTEPHACQNRTTRGRACRNSARWLYLTGDGDRQRCCWSHVLEHLSRENDRHRLLQMIKEDG